ncbi:hypothetical protein INT47_009244 [Mucor saturninus]|uniref:Uncharacterized protein n=1 Tax=Mucor saturninus TaxID=64648 RepID=A0A8H7UQQ8_9FUNG|nr:hypothetical protein INT47_009244 [Mucor saturninus]
MPSNYAIPWIKSQCYIYNRDFIYQEDGAPIHTGKYAKWYKEKIMRSIGVTSIEKFEDIVRDEWSSIDTGYLEALVSSKPARCKAVIEAKGGNTRY